MQKLNLLSIAILGSLATSCALLSPTSLAANYKATAVTPSNTVPNNNGNYKMGSYKGENRAPMKPPAPKPAKAKPIMAPITLKEGPYFGIAGGYDSYKVHEYIQLTGGTLSSSYNPTINATGIIGALMAGYGHYFNTALYLGGEVFVNTSAATQNTNVSLASTTSNISYNSKFLVSSGYGASMLPGIKLSDSALFFMRLGYQVARLRGQENATLNGGLLLQSNTSSWSGGFSYGLGFEEAMVENFSLRGEYVHTDYRSFTATSGTQYSASNNQFLLALIYHLA